MRDKDKSQYPFPALGLFLLLSIVLHIIIFISYYLLRNSIPITASRLPTLVVEFNLTPKTISESPSQEPGNTVPTSDQQADSWQKGIEAARSLMQQHGFFESLETERNSIPNHRADLLLPESRVSELTIETYHQLENGEMDIIFRYPSGKIICVRARQASQLDAFDLGSWQVLVAGCN